MLLYKHLAGVLNSGKPKTKPLGLFYAHKTWHKYCLYGTEQKVEIKLAFGRFTY